MLKDGAKVLNVVAVNSFLTYVVSVHPFLSL